MEALQQYLDNAADDPSEAEQRKLDLAQAALEQMEREHLEALGLWS